MEKVYKIELTETEVNAVLAIIAEQPYKQVAGLINRIMLQAQAQNQPQQTEAFTDGDQA